MFQSKRLDSMVEILFRSCAPYNHDGLKFLPDWQFSRVAPFLPLFYVGFTTSPPLVLTKLRRWSDPPHSALSLAFLFAVWLSQFHLNSRHSWELRYSVTPSSTSAALDSVISLEIDSHSWIRQSPLETPSELECLFIGGCRRVSSRVFTSCSLSRYHHPSSSLILITVMLTFSNSSDALTRAENSAPQSFFQLRLTHRTWIFVIDRPHRPNLIVIDIVGIWRMSDKVEDFQDQVTQILALPFINNNTKLYDNANDQVRI